MKMELRNRRVATVLAATIPPLFVLAVHELLLHLLLPYAWFLFYPAVFVSAWKGGRPAALASASLSIFLAYWFVVPPRFMLVRPDLIFVFPSAVLFGTSILYSTFFARLKKATAASQEAIVELNRAHEAERRLRAELEQVASAGIAIAEEVLKLSHTDLKEVLHMVALQAKSLSGAEYAALGLQPSPGKPLDPWVSVGVSGDAADSIDRALRTLGAMMESADGAIRRYPGDGDGAPLGPELRNLLALPVRCRRVTVAYLFVANKHAAAQFSDADERVIQLLASRTGLAIETARLYRDEALQRTWLQTVIEQMPEGVILINREGRIQSMNQMAATFALREPNVEDPFGNPMRFDVRTKDGAPVAFHDLPIVRALQRGELVTGEELLVAQQDGMLVPMLANAAPVRDVQGEIAGAAVIVQDITALKDLERLREEWTAMVAHDLRQPVTAVAVSAEMLATLRDGRMSADEQKLLQRTRLAAARMQRMISDMLDASQIESRRLSVAQQPCELTALLNEVIEQHGRELEGFTLSLAVPPGAQEAWMDRDRIAQVLSNLLSNAAKYGNPGSEVRIELLGHAAEYEVVVTNRGIGILPDQMPLLFNRFVRTREARSGTTPGLGLGLYISKGLVEAHGGRIWAESISGETSFHFTLPRAKPAGMHERSPHEADGAPDADDLVPPTQSAELPSSPG